MVQLQSNPRSFRNSIVFLVFVCIYIDLTQLILMHPYFAALLYGEPHVTSFYPFCHFTLSTGLPSREPDVSGRSI